MITNKSKENNQKSTPGFRLVISNVMQKITGSKMIDFKELPSSGIAFELLIREIFIKRRR